MDFAYLSKSLWRRSRAPRDRVDPFREEDEESNTRTNEEDQPNNMAMWMWAWIVAIVGIALSVFAVYLSWTCSSRQGQPLLMKIVLAVLAALFSIIYIIVHLVLVWTARLSGGRLPEWCSSASSIHSRRTSSSSRKP